MGILFILASGTPLGVPFGLEGKNMERYKVCFTDESNMRTFKTFSTKDSAIEFYASLPNKTAPILWDTNNTPKVRH